MHALSLTLAALSTVAIAVPATIQLRADDVVLYGNGRYQIMKRSDFDELEKYRTNGIVPPKPSYLDDTMYHGPGNDSTDPTAAAPIGKRDNSVTLIIPGAPNRFLGWDVQMSEVVRGAPTTVTVSSGYSISNTISVGVSSTFTLVKDFLQTSVSIDYSQSWTSTQTQSFSAPVPEGKYGAFVSNPWTNRQSGNVFQGVIGSDGSLSYYQADSFESKQFGSMNWVDGVISLCTGDAFPLPRCLGEGTL